VNADINANGKSLLNGNFVGRDIVNAYPFDGQDYTGGGVNVLDYNQTYALDYRAMIPNLIDRSYKTMLCYYNSSTQIVPVMPDGAWGVVTLNTAYNMGNNERLIFEVGDNSIRDVDGGQFRATATLTFNHSGAIDVTMAILVNGILSPIYVRTLHDQAPLTITGLIEISGDQRIQLALRSNNGMMHMLQVIDAKLTLEVC
jgi:hypothetical protein